MKRLRGKLTYANVMVTVLAFVVLAGGSAIAATQMLPKNSVGAKQLKKNAVTPAKLSTSSRQALQGPAGPAGAPGAAGPTGPAGASGTGPAFGVFQQGVVELAGAPKTIVTLTGLPAGAYSISATAQEFSGETKSALVSCKLAAGGAPGSGEPPPFANSILGNETDGSSGAVNISLLLLHTFVGDGGTVTLSCEEEIVSNAAEISEARIHAVKVVSESSIVG
jgi:hypothetical protein